MTASTTSASTTSVPTDPAHSVSAGSAAAPPEFATASRDHYRAARLAEAERLRISADHLAGLAAECAIKAILIDFLGSRINKKNMPEYPKEKLPEPKRKRTEWSHTHGHLPGLWWHLTAVAHRRKDAAAGILFTQLIWENPFGDWDVANRYRDDSTIAQADLERHLKAAHDLIAAHEQAHILGTRTLA